MVDITSDVFEDGESIPVRHTADGENISPPLQITGVPGSAEEIALICEDPDAPREEPWAHWVLWGLPPDTGEIPGHMSPVEEPEELPGAKQGYNDFGEIGYGGPAPPEGDGMHHYHFRVFVLEDQPLLVPGANREQLLHAMDEIIVAEDKLTGTYERS